MSLTITEIQTQVRHLARDGDLTLSSGDGLTIFNMLYRSFAALFEWPELTRTDTFTTTAGTAQYTWPSTYNYSDVKSVRIQNPRNQNKYVNVVPAKSEVTFTQKTEASDGTPEVYKREHNGTNNVITLAPAPDFSNATGQVIGVIEPSSLASGSSPTIFLEKTSDDALSYFVAADYSYKREQPEYGDILLTSAQRILSTKFGKEIVTMERMRRALSVQG
jgi:hypothetical protein